MRFLGVAAVFGLAVAWSAAADDPPAKGKATVQLVGQFTADKDTTLRYTLKKGGKVVVEEKDIASLPSKGVEVSAADAAGPFELTVSATGGVAKVTQIGVSVTVTADGKTKKGMFGGRPFDLNAKDAAGATLRALTVTVTPAEEPKKIDDKMKTDVPKKLPDVPKKKTDDKPPPAAPDPREK
jgi:hypothetical protein